MNTDPLTGVFPSPSPWAALAFGDRALSRKRRDRAIRLVPAG